MTPGSGLNACSRMMAGCLIYYAPGQCRIALRVTLFGWRWMVARSCMFVSRFFCG
nr:MAG TPA: hypothetical protein [Caudoviricetes sp.]